MTIPIIPGPWSGLGQGLQAGINSYDESKQRQYEEANNSARLILGLIQSGRIDPSIISDPSFQQNLQRAKIPVPPAATVVPSSAAERERATVGIARGTEKPSTQRMLTLNINGTPAQVGEDEFKAHINAVKDLVMQDPNSPGARYLAEVFTPDVYKALESSRQAAAAPEAYGYAAKHYVALAGLGMGTNISGEVDIGQLAGEAFRQAGKDPKWAPLIASGQLGLEHFAEAAREYALLNEDQRIKWADAYARQMQARGRLDDFYDSQRKAYDVQLGQLDAREKQNALTIEDKAFLNSARKKLQANPKAELSEFEREAIRKQMELREIERVRPILQQERQDIIDRGIGVHTPVDPNALTTPPQVGAPGARRAVPSPYGANPPRTGAAPRTAAPAAAPAGRFSGLPDATVVQAMKELLADPKNDVTEQSIFDHKELSPTQKIAILGEAKYQQMLQHEKYGRRTYGPPAPVRK